MVRRCTVFYGGLPCVRAMYCMLWWCTVCYDGVLYVRVVYYILG